MARNVYYQKQILDMAMENDLIRLGSTIRDRRKALGISATAAAEAAGTSRVTWHRIENGEPSVAFGTWVRAAGVLGLRLRLRGGGDGEGAPVADGGDVLPLRIRLADYPQLERLGWQLRTSETLTPREAHGLYERNWRHVDEAALDPRERALIEALRLVYAAGPGDV